MKYSKRIYMILFVAGLLLLLIYAQSLLVPFVLAILIWVVIRVLKKVLRRVPWVKNWPNWLLTLLSTVMLLSLLGTTVMIISKNIHEMSVSMPIYEANVDVVSARINEVLNIDLTESVAEMIAGVNYAEILSTLFSALTSIFGDAFMILLYLVFILLEESTFHHKLRAIYIDPEKRVRAEEMMAKIDSSINNYIAIKTLMSLLTGILSFFVLLFIGVEAPFFWAFIIFVLNYIPAIGSLIATLFPAVFALLQFGDFTQPLLVLTIVGSIQIVVGNFLEPKVMGNNLNISTLVVFLTLAIWGSLWGATGMLLSVPITVILILILAEFPGGRNLAIMLTKKGNLG